MAYLALKQDTKNAVAGENGFSYDNENLALYTREVVQNNSCHKTDFLIFQFKTLFIVIGVMKTNT